MTSRWEQEFDARLSDDGVKKDTMSNAGFFRPREVRVADDGEVMRRRNGASCCGCGRATGHHGEAPDHDPDVPRVTNPRYRG